MAGRSVTVESVTVMQCPVGNLWDVFLDNRRIGRVTYHGNELMFIKANLFGNPWKQVTKKEVADALDQYYPDKRSN